jgi:hypothetical protein
MAALLVELDAGKDLGWDAGYGDFCTPDQH